tara:strand:- start:632 stop:1672 length:1041 start_codon:yes stop_codon:yes gene_type:complete
MNTKIAIIGSGFGMYCLLPAFSNTNKCDVVSICGKKSERMSNFCKKFNVKQYDDWKKMLDKEKPNAIAVAVIPKYQFEIIKFALENNIAVFAEKPLTTNYQNSLELYELAKKNKLPNMVDFEFTQIPEWIDAKNILETEKIGKIVSIELDWTFLSYDLANGIKSWKTNIEEGGGALSLVFSHTFYYLEYFLGKIKNINCSLSSSKNSLNHGDTTIDMKLLFQNGCNGNIHVDISDNENQKHIIKFIGTNGELKLENFSNDFLDNFELKLKLNNELQKTLHSQKLNFLNDKTEDSRIKFVATLTNKFINWCNTGISTKPNFEDGLRVQKLIETSRENNENNLRRSSL